jgi:hypothetical protein
LRTASAAWGTAPTATSTACSACSDGLLATAAPLSVVFFSFSFWGISVFTPNEVADGSYYS